LWGLFHRVKVTLMSDKAKKTGPFNSLREFMDASGLKKVARKILHQ